MIFQITMTLIMAIISYVCYKTARQLIGGERRGWWAPFLGAIPMMGFLAAGLMAVMGAYGIFLIAAGYATV